MTIRSCEISDTLLAELRAYLSQQSDDEAARLNAAQGGLAYWVTIGMLLV